MIVTKPFQIYISNSGTKKFIRFSTTFINQGDGPLEILGHADEEQSLTYASQYLKEKGGPGMYQELGKFVFHAGHTHWHIEDYVFYQLIPFDSQDKTPIRQTDKMSFCIWDEDNEDLEIPNASDTRVYTFTCSRQIQGMSVGWSDTYDANFDGQEIDITGVPDGRYIFRSIVNPNKNIKEKDLNNNTSEIVIEIAGNNLTEIE